MPTVSQMIESFKKAGRYDEAREHVYKKTGLDFEAMPPEADWEAVKAIAKTRDLVKPGMQVVDTMTAGQDLLPRYIDAMGAIGRSLSPQQAPRKRRPYFTKPTVQQVVERHPSDTPLEGMRDLVEGSVKGGVKGLTETGMAYAGKMMGPLAILMGQDLQTITSDPYQAQMANIETPGGKYMREVIDPALEMPIHERAWEGAKGMMGGSAMIARAALGGGTRDERLAVGQGLGEGMTSGLAGSMEALARNPAKVTAGQPFETGIMVTGPAARAVGAGVRAAGMAARGGRFNRFAKGMEVAGDVLDPQPGTRRYAAGPVESFDLSPEQGLEYARLQNMERSGMLPEGTADKWVDSLKQDFSQRMVREATEASTASKVGFAARRAAASALLAGDIVGGGVGGALTAAGLGAIAPPLLKAGARRFVPQSSRNRARQFWTDPTAMPDPESEAVVISTTTAPLRQGLGIHDMGVEAAARASRARARPRPAREGETPLEMYRETRVLGPESEVLSYPGSTVGQARALESGRRREGAAASMGEFAARELDAAAKGISGDKSYYRRAKQYIRDRDAARAKFQEADAAARKLLDKKEADIGAFDYENARMAAAVAREEYLKARGKADLYFLKQEAQALKDPATFNEWQRLKEEWRAHIADAETARKQLDESTAAFRKEVAELAERETGMAQSTVADPKQTIRSRDLEGRQSAKTSLEGVLADKDRFQEMLQWRKAAWRRYDEARKAAEESFGKIEQKAVDLVNLRRDLNAKEAALSKRAEVMSQLPESRQKELREGARSMRDLTATEAAARASGETFSDKAQRQRASLFAEEGPEAPRVLRTVEAGAYQRDRAAKAAKLVEEYPPTEAAAKLVSGQKELVGQVFDPRKKDGTKFNRKYVKVIQDSGLEEVIDATAALVRSATPDSPLADPSYLGQVIATVWQRRALVGAFSARTRGYMSKAMTNQMFDTIGIEQMRKVLSNYKEGIDTSGWRRGKVEREMRSMLEKEISKVSSEAIISGKPTEFRLVLQGKDGHPVVLDSGTLASKFLRDPNRSIKERQAIANEAVSGVFDTIKSHYIRDETRASIAREALRTSSLDPFTVDSRTNGFAAMRAATDPNIVKPNVLLFNPEEFFAQFSDPRSVVAEARMWLDDPKIPKGPEGDQIVLERARQAARFYMRDFVEADGDVRAALAAGLAMRGRTLKQGAPVYVRSGYNTAVGTHLRFTQTMEEANNLLLDFAQYGKVQALAGSTSTQVANMFSNVTAISMATGQSPYKVMAGIAEEYRKLWTQVERGTLEGFEAKKYRGIMRSGIADSSQLSERFGGLFRGDSSKGRVRAGAEQYFNIRKEIYKQGDTGPKLYLTSRAFDDIYDSVRNLEPRRYLEMPTGKGSYIRVERTGFNTVKAGGKTYDLGDQAFIDMVAESAKKFAGDILFDFNDMPGFVKSLMSSKAANYTMFNPYMAWAFKAAELPGKPGLVGNMMSYDPTWGLKTNSPALMKDRAKKFAKLAIKRKVQNEAFRQVANVYRSAGMGEMIGYDGATDALLFNPFSSELETIDVMDQGSGAPTVMADAAMRIFTAGGVEAAAALGKWVGRTPEQYSAMARSEDPQERAVGKLWQLMASGDIATRKEVAAFMGLTGGMFNSVMEYLKDPRKGPVPAAQLMMRLMLGGDIQSSINAGLEARDPGTTWTTRQYLKTVERKENFAKWWFYSMFRFGFRERDYEKGVERWVDKRKQDIKNAYMKRLKQRVLNLEGELSNDKKYPEGSEARARLERSLDEAEREIDMYDAAIDEAGATFEDAADRALSNWYDRQDSVRAKRKERQTMELRRSMSGAAEAARQQMPLARRTALDALSAQTR